MAQHIPNFNFHSQNPEKKRSTSTGKPSFQPSYLKHNYSKGSHGLTFVKNKNPTSAKPYKKQVEKIHMNPSFNRNKNIIEGDLISGSSSVPNERNAKIAASEQKQTQMSHNSNGGSGNINNYNGSYKSRSNIFNSKSATYKPFSPGQNTKKSVNKSRQRSNSPMTRSSNLSLGMSHNNNKKIKHEISFNPIKKFKSNGVGSAGNITPLKQMPRSATPILKTKFSLGNINNNYQGNKTGKNAFGMKLSNSQSSSSNIRNKYFPAYNHSIPGKQFRNHSPFVMNRVHSSAMNSHLFQVPKSNSNTTSMTMSMHINMNQDKENYKEVLQENSKDDTMTSMINNNNHINNNEININEALIDNSFGENRTKKNATVNSQPNLLVKSPLNPDVVKVIKRMHEFSKTGYAGEDEKKVNQDNYFVFRNFVNSSKNIFMGVCDGHGPVGQEISGFLKENLPNDLNKALRASRRDIIKDSLNDIIYNVFLNTDYKLIKNDMINSLLSGSTCASLIYTPTKIITANVGDSRAILGRCSLNDEWTCFELTRDHKPDEEDEYRRIIAKNGRIEQMKDDDGEFVGPQRVWLENDQTPGLAMSRSFGDRIAHAVGVISEPEIKEYKFEVEDKFCILASDGLYEFMTNQEIIDIVKKYYLADDIVGCCEYLYKISCERWMDLQDSIDDITIIIVFLDDN